ncbi:hypothetical protein CC1G_03264 [Coprinopsis cinerea okayama7|uniref:Uncharacterized protein n=1 Tax=Coprinopsis cinerea (strain Okayama-7 / 130 / ATCC MYA-4618 / FGSC 9003) TaxID=240176 RepID=A8N7C1_COPC7|nr:hypothetical protein CC1G_03264 [Coprinopsis cinerea okayama7\|eukprot:XP_001830727.2 hypothetical protein CC1G_03264 [Coprinopsis cinerea okayama7\
MNSSYSVVDLYTTEPSLRRGSGDSSGDSDGCLTPADLSPSSPSLDSIKSTASYDGSVFSEGPAILDIPVELIEELTKGAATTPVGSRQHRRSSADDQHKRQLLELKRRIESLEEENEILKDYTVSVILEKERASEDLASLRINYYEELGASKAIRRQLDQMHTELIDANKKLAEAERFILDLVDLKLGIPVLQRLSQSTDNPRISAGSFLRSIQETLENTRASWLEHLPALEGSRTLDHYLCALNLTINARKELRENHRVSQFWKLLAKSDPNLANTVTPSSSELEKMDAADSSTARMQVLDELIGQLKEDVARKRDSGCFTPPTQKSDIDCPPSTTPSNEAASSSTLPLPEEVDPAAPIDRHERPATPPSSTMSQSPIDSPPRLLDRSSQIPQRSPGRTTKLPSTRRKGSSIIHDRLPSLAALAERLADSQASADGSQPTVEPEVTMSAEASSTRRTVKGVSFPPASSRKNRRPGHILNDSDDAGPSPLLACQALISLERICAAFSSTSLGSLEMTEESRSQGRSSTLPSSSSAEVIRPEDDAGENLTSVGASPSAAELHPVKTVDPTTPTTFKSVRWAVPLSPDHDGTLSPSPSDADTNSSVSNGPSPPPQSRGRRRSLSSPTPVRRGFMGDNAKSTLARSIQVLKPRPNLPAPSTPRKSSLPVVQPRSTSPRTTNSSWSSQGSSASRRKGSSESNTPPRIPPRSPLRQPSPSSRKTATVTPADAATSASSSKMVTSTPSDIVKLTSLPPNSPTKSHVPVKVYDYTKPVMPLKVVKKTAGLKENVGVKAGNVTSPITPLQPKSDTKPPSESVDGQVKKPKPTGTTIIPPIRTSSLRPPKLVQATLRQARVGPLQVIRQNRPNPAEPITSPVAIASEQDLSTGAGRRKESPPSSRKAKETVKIPKGFTIDPSVSSPLTKLRLTVTPPGSLIRPVSKPRQR